MNKCCSVSVNCEHFQNIETSGVSDQLLSLAVSSDEHLVDEKGTDDELVGNFFVLNTAHEIGVAHIQTGLIQILESGGKSDEDNDEQKDEEKKVIISPKEQDKDEQKDEEKKVTYFFTSLINFRNVLSPRRAEHRTLSTTLSRKQK